MKSFFAIVLWAMATLKIAIKEAAAVTGLKWNKRLQDFEPIPGVPSYEVEKQRRIFQSRREETHDFNGEPLKITYFQDPGFFEFYDNDTKATGICGDIWTVLSQLLNFTLVLTRIESSSTKTRYKANTFRVIMSNVRRNKTDIIPKIIITKRLLGTMNFTPVLWTNRLRIFAHARWKGNSGWMFDTFSIEVWTVVLIFIVTLSFASTVTQKVLIRNRVLKLRDRSYFAHLFYTFATLCNQGNAPDNTGSGSKMLTLTVGIFSWLTLTAFGACLTKGMTLEAIDSPFNDFVTLLENTQFQILVLANTFSSNTLFRRNAPKIMRRIVKANRISVESNLDDLYRKVCLHPDKYVLFDEEDAVTTRNITHCSLFPVDKPRYRMPIASGMSGRVKYKKSLVIGMTKLHESGVISRIKNHYMSSKMVEPTVRHTTTQFIDVRRVSVIFATLGIGILASLVICALENIVFALKKRKNISRTRI